MPNAPYSNRYLQGKKEEDMYVKEKFIISLNKKLIDISDFIFADPFLPYGTIGIANTHCTHLQIAQANPHPKSAKECNFSQHSELWFAKSSTITFIIISSK